MDNENIFKLVLEKLEKIESRLDSIESEINNIKSSTEKMDTHISFVEHIYDTVKSPFYYIINKVSYKKIEEVPLKTIQN